MKDYLKVKYLLTRGT